MRSTLRRTLALGALLSSSVCFAQARPTPIDQIQMTPIAASTCAAGKSCVYWSSVDGKLHQRTALGVDVAIGSGGGGSGTATGFQLVAGPPGSPAGGDVWYDLLSGAFCGRWSGGSDCFARLGANTFTGAQKLQAAAVTTGTRASPLLTLEGQAWDGSASQPAAVTMQSTPQSVSVWMFTLGVGSSSFTIADNPSLTNIGCGSGGGACRITGYSSFASIPSVQFGTNITFPSGNDIYTWRNGSSTLMRLQDDGVHKGTLLGLSSIPGLVPDAASNSGLCLKSDGTVWAGASCGGGGTVTSVATGAGLTGGPITTTGTVDLLLNASGGLVKNLGAGTNELGIGAGGVTNAMLAGSIAPSKVTGTAVVGTDSRLPPTPTAAGKLLYDTGSGYAEGPACSSGQVPHGAGAGPYTCSAVSLTADVSGLLPPANGGLGVGAPAANGQVPISKSDGTVLWAGLTAGANVTITPGANTITIASSGGASGYATIQNAGTPLTQRATANCSTGLTCTDNAGASRTDIALTNTATTVNGQTCTLGSTCTVTAAPSGSAGGALAGSYPNPTIASGATITSPIITTGLTASGSAANDFSASTGAFKTSTGVTTIGGGQICARRAIADAAATITTADYLVAYTSISTTRAAQLPNANVGAGTRFLVGDESGSVTASILINVTSAGGTVDGVAAATGVNIAVPRCIAGFESDGTNWHTFQGLTCYSGAVLRAPTIADFTNANHTHAGASTGGTLNASAIAAGTLATARGGTNLDTSASTGVATVSSGAWSILALLTVALGGTGIASYAVGDLLYASASTTLSKLADVAAGSYLRSGGVTTAPVWSTLTLPNSATTGDLFYASGSNAMGNLAKCAAGELLNYTSTRPQCSGVYDYRVELSSGTTGAGNVDTTVLSVPAGTTSNTGSFGLTLTARITQAIVGGGTVTVTCGTSAGGTEYLASTGALTSSATVGTRYGFSTATVGSACTSGDMYSCIAAGSSSVICRTALSGTVSTALKILIHVQGAQQ